MTEQEIYGPAGHRSHHFKPNGAAQFFDVALQEAVRMSAHKNLVGMARLGPEIPLGQPQIGKRVNTQEKQATRAKNPEDLADDLRSIADVVQNIETDGQAGATVLKRQRLSRRTDKMQRVSA